MKSIAIITTDNCKECANAKYALKSKGINYYEYKNTNDKAMQIFGNIITGFPTLILFDKGNKNTIIDYFSGWGTHSPAKLNNWLKE